MGCASSKRVEATVAADIYRPAPTSFALFDINAIEEPWLINAKQQQFELEEKPLHVPAPIIEKLDMFERASDAPRPWIEVSKVLEDLKPTLKQKPAAPDHRSPPKPVLPQPGQVSPDPVTPLKESQSFHTLEELDAKLSRKSETPPESNGLKLPTKTLVRVPTSPQAKSDGFKLSNKDVGPDLTPLQTQSDVVKPLKENIFILKDRLEREREGKGVRNLDRRIGVKGKRDPLADFPEKCPPCGADAIVLYTTTLRGVRRTFEDCQRVRSVMEAYHVAIDERDVSLHGEYLKELRELLGEDVGVPRLFVKGRYVGGADEILEMNEACRLIDVLSTVESAKRRNHCDGCGNARFVPCLECNGSCKVLGEDKKETFRCTKCNENGLVQCPLCH